MLFVSVLPDLLKLYFSFFAIMFFFNLYFLICCIYISNLLLSYFLILPSSFFLILPFLFQHLYLSSSAVTSLGPGDLPALPNLNSLSLANTGLTTILPGAFKQVFVIVIVICVCHCHLYLCCVICIFSSLAVTVREKQLSQSPS